VSDRDARDGMALWMLLESQIAGVIVDAVVTVTECLLMKRLDWSAVLFN
jgi:hypothetical protein